jgi:hypothetical protein
VSTATPDEGDARESGAGADTVKSAKGDTAADTVVTKPAAPDEGSARSSDAGTRGSDQAAPGGPPPPWQRAGSRSESGSRSDSGARGESGARPTEGEQRAAGRPSPGPGGDRPATPAAETPRPTPQPPPSGTAPAGKRPTSPPSGPLPVQGPGGQAQGQGQGRNQGQGQGQRRSNTALIDAPTNQLSPEQLGMRTRGRSEPEPDLDDLDDDDVPTARPSPRGKVPRRASLQVKRFDPWSVLKLALVLGVALFFVWMFAVGVLYAVLDGMGVWAQLNGTYQDLTSDTGGAGGQLITAGGVFGVAAIVGVVNTILFTALASVSAFIYNISADVAGGIEVTLSERD